jgi:uncharacterized protein (DUF1778 family)
MARVHAGRSRGGAKRDRRILLVLSTDEQERIDAAADRAGVARAQWMREIALTAAGAAAQVEAAETAAVGQPMAAELASIGRLLNQAVRAANTAAKAGHPMPAGLTEAVDDCRQAIAALGEGIEDVLAPIQYRLDGIEYEIEAELFDRMREYIASLRSQK